MRSLALTLLLFSQFTTFSTAIKTDEEWKDAVPNTAPFQALSSACARRCIQNIYTVKDCRSYGCVCSENDPFGTNLIANYGAITACVQNECGGGSLVQETANTFKVICANAVGIASNLTATTILSSSAALPTTSIVTLNQTITTAVTVTSTPTASSAAGFVVPTGTCATYNFNRPPSFDRLSSCSKFVYTGCRDGYGNREEKDCGPINTPAGWEDYKGIEEFLKTCEAYYLCAGAYFFLTLTQLYNQSTVFCNYRASVNGSVDMEWDKTIGVMADFCKRAEIPLLKFQYDVIGPKDTVGQSGKEAPDQSGLTGSDIIAIAVGIAAVVLPTLYSIPMLFATWRTYKWAKEMREKSEAAATSPSVTPQQPAMMG
ncbi:hypothetical protein QBC35DRAFT_97537 [Podospora australis]|uniref:Extracellular membrane protein CFEM domain-containing protein n=1 Tax=Podospora australis TaxID=1536484 RepID=A0AAN7AF30_9PEZI|nr:hypothetical protein QBC35DRAFT_97537 [Podospora australis]